MLPFIFQACQALTIALPRNLYICIFQIAVNRLTHNSTALYAQNNHTRHSSALEESNSDSFESIRVTARDHGVRVKQAHTTTSFVRVRLLLPPSTLWFLTRRLAHRTSAMPSTVHNSHGACTPAVRISAAQEDLTGFLPYPRARYPP